MELLKIQSDVHDATQPGGVLCKDLWVISSLAMHDLLLAAVITYLCLLQEGICVSRDQQVPNTHQTEMIAALEKSCRIWSETRGTSVVTRKAYAVLSNMLKRTNVIFQCNKTESGVCDDAPAYDPVELLSMSLPGLSAGTSSSYNGGQYEGDAIHFPSPTIQSDIDLGSIPLNLIGELDDTPMYFDWVCKTFSKDLRPDDADFSTGCF